MTTPSEVLDPTRLAALYQLELLDTAQDPAFERLTRLAARVLRCPVALITLVDSDRQFFLSCRGLGEPWKSARETPLSHSFCQHTVVQAAPFVVTDARNHPLVADNLAIRDLNVISYLGIPLVIGSGAVIGSLCVIDEVPREWSQEEIETLQDLTSAVVAEIELRTETQARAKAQSEIAYLLGASKSLYASLNFEQTAHQFASILLPELADWALIELFQSEQVEQRRLLVTLGRGGRSESVVLPTTRPAAPELGRWVTAVEREPRRFDAVPPELAAGLAAVGPQVADLTRTAMDSLMIVPLHVAQQSVGVLVLAGGPERPAYSDGDLLLATDIAGRAAMALLNARLHGEARAAIRQRDEFISVAAHELSHPTTTIAGYAELIARQARSSGELSSALRQRLDRLAHEGQRLQQLTRMLLDTTQLSGNRLQIERRHLSLDTLADHVLSLVAALWPDHHFEYQRASEPLLLNGDETRLEQVLYNLLHNAAKYSPAGGRIEFCLGGDGANVLVSIRDEGIGIPADELPRLFNRYFRASNARGGATAGMGLGLYVVHEIVHLHGGEITVESVEGEGTLVRLSLPALSERVRTPNHGEPGS